MRKESDSNDNLLKQWIEAENSHDVEKVLPLLTDDILIEDMTFGVAMKEKNDIKKITTNSFSLNLCMPITSFANL